MTTSVIIGVLAAFSSIASALIAYRQATKARKELQAQPVVTVPIITYSPTKFSIT